jgi:ribosomal protein S18 acetylase RimI-like enzyme
MKFININAGSDLSVVVKVLNEAHGTIANDFGFTRESNPTNNAFIDAPTLQSQMEKGIGLYLLTHNQEPVGCIAIEKAIRETDTFYIEKVSVVPSKRHQGFGVQLMDFATNMIRENGGKRIGIALIDSNLILKQWYTRQGFVETGIKDFEHLPFRVCFMNKMI